MKLNTTCDILEIELPEFAEGQLEQLVDMIAELIARDILMDVDGEGGSA